MHPQHLPDRGDTGNITVRLVGSLVAVMIAASVAALALHAGDGGGSGHHADSAASSAVATTPAPSSALKPAAVVSANPATTAPATTNPATTQPAASRPARKSVTYVVQPGDNLTVIAAWFHEHGYGDLYERNKAVIGHDPNLILPGQRITISNGAMTVAG